MNLFFYQYTKKEKGVKENIFNRSFHFFLKVFFI